MKIPQNYFEKVYAGWLGKIIGIRIGAPIEGWTYEKIERVFGELTDYPVAYKDFAADDDSNGPLFFLRSLEDYGLDLKSQYVGNALLNYAPYEHAFFWWGGYGVSTEHTAYLNLRNGIPAPRSGSVEQNGAMVAEQIGGQIFIDTWGLVTPNNPKLAAQYAKEAASATHGGNGVYGGMFIAVCISLAFAENNIQTIIDKALDYIPSDCEYAKVTRDVIKFFKANPNDWRACFKYIFNNYGYDKYDGNCHIIPNSAVMILSMLYGKGSFTDTINICNMCGWDTDCNVANVGTILGVMNGLEGIDYPKWRKPINDFLACSSVIGSLNAMDIPYGASYIAKLAYKITGEEIPNPWRDIIENKIHSAHFEYPGSTHAMRVKGAAEYFLKNTDETAATGNRSLKFTAKADSAEEVYLYQKTYYAPEDFHDSRYDPAFSPLLYPGQTVHGSVLLEKGYVQLYVKDKNTGKTYKSEKTNCSPNWQTISYTIPSLEGACIYEAGYIFTRNPFGERFENVSAFIDDFYFDGTPDYTVEFEKEKAEVWNGLHKEISQFTIVKGNFSFENEYLHLSCSDFAESYTGRYDWTDYTFTANLTPLTGENHYVNFRVRGAIHSYAVGLCENSKIALLKNCNGYSVLAESDFSWSADIEYSLKITVKDNHITVMNGEKEIFSFTDTDNPYLKGSIGISVHNGSHCKYRKLSITQ